jgi:hypothetical protein
MPKSRRTISGPSDAAIQYTRRLGGVAILFNGQQGSGKSMALEIIRGTLADLGWQIDVVDDLNHELLVRMPPATEPKKANP